MLQILPDTPNDETIFKFRSKALFARGPGRPRKADVAASAAEEEEDDEDDDAMEYEDDEEDDEEGTFIVCLFRFHRLCIECNFMQMYIPLHFDNMSAMILSQRTYTKMRL